MNKLTREAYKRDEIRKREEDKKQRGQKMDKQMNIRNVSDDTKMRFDVLNATEQHKTQADTLKFLLDYYEEEVVR